MFVYMWARIQCANYARIHERHIIQMCDFILTVAGGWNVTGFFTERREQVSLSLSGNESKPLSKKVQYNKYSTSIVQQVQYNKYITTSAVQQV